MNVHTARRKRRRAKKKMSGGGVRRHCKKAGRTGSILVKRVPAKRINYRMARPNPPGPTGYDILPPRSQENP